MASEIRVNSLTNRSGLSTVTIADTGAVVAGIVTATTFSGPLTGAVTGNVTGDLTGNVTGNVTGNITGNVTGNTSGTAGGLTGSPSITVTDITATGNVSIGGTLTYEDVTNIDSVGIITAQSDVLVGRNLSVTSGISTVKSLDYAAIDSTISDTAYDVFVYDTSKDSDGGAWRKRTQHTSWYNETLNTSTRGSRKEFPAVAVIVALDNVLRIYDGDDPDLPMWMVFTGADASNYTGPHLNIAAGSTLSAVAALNGEIVVTCNSGNYPFGSVQINFLKDRSLIRPDVGGKESLTGIAKRNETGSYNPLQYPYTALVNKFANDVAVTVLPNAPIDDATGLPVPTIAVATNRGVSIIKDNGTVIDLEHNSGTHETCRNVAFSEDKTKLLFESDANDDNTYRRRVIVEDIPSADTTFTVIQNDSYQTTTGGYDNGRPRILGGNTSSTGINEVLPQAIASGEGITFLDNELDDILNSRVAYATTSYNTGWMQGDIKGAFLSDTDTTNVTGSELVTNGTFSSDVSGWTASNGTITHSSGTAVVNRTGGSGPVAYQTITTVVGETYVLSGTVDSTGTGNRGDIRAYSDNGSTMLVNASGTDNQTVNVSGTFTATTTTTYIYFVLDSTGTGTFDNVSVRIAEEDRSVNNKGLQVFGTVTKSVVATGADLVAYSGFTDNDYLTQPYNSDLDFGTGDYYMSIWAKGGGSAQCLMIREHGTADDDGAMLLFQHSDKYAFYSRQNGTAGWTTFLADNAAYGNYWSHLVMVRTGGTLYGYVNGKLEGSTSFAGDVSNNDAKIYIGRRNPSVDNSQEYSGSLALARIGGSAPSPEQIKKMYEDEKHLFQENAKATLYGSSDAVTALAYDDDTDLLHVGTSSGRSDFQGLRRINNTTTAVTTAITAQNEFIIEQ